MNTYTYKNITTNVTTINPQWVDSMGETKMTLSSDFVAELLENSCTFGEFFGRFEYEELKSELNDDTDELAKHFKNLNEEVTTRDPDAIIAVYEYALDNDDRQFSFSVETENISWVIHDILHAVHDAAGCTIYVASEIEKNRIIKSLKITKEQFPNELPDSMVLEQLEDAFYSRFKERLDLEGFKYLEEEYY